MLSLDTLNSRLQNMRFLNEASYQGVPLVKKSAKIGGSANENSRLLLIFPWAVYDTIDTTDSVWKMVLALREICLLIMSVNISIGQVAYLNRLLHEYIDMRRLLFPTNILRHSPNFKNVLFSLSEKHQLLQALLMSQPSTFNDKVVSEDATPLIYEHYPEAISKLIKTSCVFQDPKFISDRVIFRGVDYKREMYVCYGQNKYGNFLLCRIKYIVISGCYTDIFFLGERHEIIQDCALGVYIEEPLQETTDLICVHYSLLTPHEPVLQFVTHDGSVLFCFKSTPFTNL
ncbi:hypothetical protein ILUMI_15053 [Ignelater luminosus]|uniref:Uncharacterized protein n=1 Tax=Ignelater luminosus TaxID=2038154 RepID=A0A8K0G490_IGNLU|nr:hypothetical protein ILUMI_15053 [Ignelater luminosus]